MLSVIDLLDFIDLDVDTLQVVENATRLPVDDATALARQLLATEAGISIVHHMYRDQIADATANSRLSRQQELRRAYTQFSRKYPQLPRR